jgi:hypothetical protein
MSNNKKSAEDFIKKLDDSVGEWWSNDQDALANAFVAYAKLKNEESQINILPH